MLPAHIKQVKELNIDGCFLIWDGPDSLRGPWSLKGRRPEGSNSGMGRHVPPKLDLNDWSLSEEFGIALNCGALSGSASLHQKLGWKCRPVH